jgi:DNA-binding response OmpR family regulator
VGDILEGHLEDVDLLEVVKVIGLGRRSGVLTVTAPHATGEVLFAYGKVLRLQLSSNTESVGQLLQGAGVLGAHDLAAAGSQTLDDVLRHAQQRRPAETGIITRAEATLRERLEESLEELLTYDEGSFAFRVTESVSAPERYPRDTSLVLSDGLDPDGVLRAVKKRRANRSKLPQPARARSADGAPEDTAPRLFVVDDDPRFLGQTHTEATHAGLDVSAFDSARAGIEALRQMNGETPQTTMIVDLVMPRPNGRGLLGGLQVCREAAERGVADRIFLAFDDEHSDARRMAEELGVQGILIKPRSGEGFSGFLNPVLQRLGKEPIVDAPVDLVGELRLELGADAGEWSAEPDLRLDDSSRALVVLKSLLGQINNPAYEDEIQLLLLRFAAAFFARGALFGVHQDSGNLVGLGGYGLPSEDPGRTIHAIKIPMSADTVFTRAMQEKNGVRQPFYESEWNLRLITTLGGPRPREVYTAPLMSPRGLEAVLYADNAGSHRAFPDVALLEIFVQQAGVAIERSSLVRKVETLMRETQPPGPA